ncbi:GTPase HflX [Parablautia muri]|uniref:GTPase HflX n=1 Tax=Parablautia muri TaxID=2320879 RepID=A0A9X5BCM8_9FIRM|nr:GTPase HflX [Parablautia muri]NBJ91531.1 GTPase HflX [Parablautia muri]
MTEFEKEKSIKEDKERVLLVGVDNGAMGEDFERSMDELKSLAKACFMEPVGVMTQKMESVNKGLYVGTGKVQEIKETARILEVDVIIFDDALSPSQLRNLQQELQKPILDRTTLILDIFERRARTREAKLQVESAKLKYLLPRLVGMHEALTRQGGASGSMSSRGAGEKKLELDRRRIEKRIGELSKELEEVSRERRVQRKKRVDARIPLVALVGYTNAGKSTILNAMIDACSGDVDKKVLEKDMLFATLDTTVRRICTGNHKDFLLSDTVGFIHKLPHGLVKAFHSTLEEVECADLLIHVVDYSDPHYKEHMQTTAQTLFELNAGNIPVITVFNKVDRCDAPVAFPQMMGKDKVYMSAKDKDSIAFLVSAVLARVYADYVWEEFLIPYDKGNVLSYLMENTHTDSWKYEEKGTRIKVKCHKADREKYREYRVMS